MVHSATGTAFRLLAVTPDAVRRPDRAFGPRLTASTEACAAPHRPASAAVSTGFALARLRVAAPVAEHRATAAARYQDIAQHTVRLSAEIPGDDVLDCRMIVAVRGTGTPWDQDYLPDVVRRTMSAEGGYRMTLSAKNIAAA